MPPDVENTASLEACLRSLVRYYLDCMMHSNAIFLCERLVACNPREENVLLLATCHFGESSELRAHALLQGCRMPESRFLLATCCLNLGRLAEAERVLLQGTGVLQKGARESRDEILADPCPIPFGAAGLRLLGLACQGAGRRESAEEYFRLSLELDPLMWVSIQSLCELGADFDVEKHFESLLEKAAIGAAAVAAKRSAGGAGTAAAKGKRLPWSAYLQASSGGRVDDDGCSGPGGWRGDGCLADPAHAMPPPPPPGARFAAASGSALTGNMETPTRPRGGEAKHSSPVGGGALFGTPAPTQRRSGNSANAGATHSQAFMTPAFRTPVASSVRFSTAGGNTTPGGGIGGRGRSVRGTFLSAAVGRGKNSKRKGAGAPRGGARPAAAAAVSSAVAAASASDGMGHLLDLGARLGAFFPPAVGPGPVPGLEQLLREASEAVSSANVKEEEGDGRPTPAAATLGEDDIGTPAGGMPMRGVGGVGIGRFFSTPGLTPIPTARTPGHAGDDALGADMAAEDTPSMFLAGLLRGTPGTSRGALRDGGTSFSETPVLHEDGRPPEPVGMRAVRMAAAVGGGVESSALGMGVTAAVREVGTGGGEAGVAAGEVDGIASVRAGTRMPRGAATGGRRVGGRLSFSSAVGADDTSSTGSAVGGGGGGVEDHGRTTSRAQGKRRIATPGTTTPSASNQPRHTATSAARGSMRPPPPAPGAGGSGATPVSASLAGRASRLSSTGGGGSRVTRNANWRSIPMDVDDGDPAVRRSSKGDGAGVISASASGSGGAAERTPVTQNSRRPNTRAASKRTGVGADARQAPSGSVGVASARVPEGLRSATRNNGVVGGAGSCGNRGRGVEGAMADGRRERGGDGVVRITREQWERAQYEETIAFAAAVLRRKPYGGEVESAGDGKEERQGGRGTENSTCERPGDREKVIAALAVLKAAAQASEAARAAVAVGGADREEWTAAAASRAGAGDWAVARSFPHQTSGRREPGGGGDSAAGGKVLVEAGLRTLASLLVVLGKGYQYLMQFRCAEALEELKRLSPAQFCTGWVLHQVGKAYFERADYANAKSALESMQRYDPHRLEGLDLLSTTLWHLKREVELSYLAQKVSEFDRLSPYTWCVVGNCFSLQKEHETALRFFQRAIQLDSEMTYAYTLCGHEYVVNEDFDKAVACFRMAIRTDRRHYNAWYGLGSIYHRQEKYDMAEYHFRRALSINPQSSVLRVYLGMVLHANKRYLDALDMLGEASKSKPTNPQASFQRANVLMSMERYAEALQELENVRSNVPKESAVYFLMGKVCKKLGQTGAAMRHFTIALDLHNKDKNLIKAAVDRLNEPDLDEEEKF